MKKETRGKKSLYDTMGIMKKIKSINGWVAIGDTDKMVAEKLGVTPQTISNWKNKHPEFAKALAKRRNQTEGELVNSAIQQAKGFYYTEQTAIKLKKEWYDMNNKKNSEERVELIDVEKYARPNGFIMQFLLQNFLPANFKNTTYAQITGSKLEDYFSGEDKDAKGEEDENNGSTDNNKEKATLGEEPEKE